MLRGRVADADRNLRAATSFTDRGSPLWCRLQLLIGEFAEFTSMERALAHYSAALPASAGDRKGSIWVCAVMVALVWGWLSLVPVPDSCRVLRAGGRVTGARSARAAGVAGALDAFAWERIMPGGGGREPLVAMWFSGSGWWPFCAG